MTGLFHHSLLNDALDDPVLVLRQRWNRRVLLFDAGNLKKLSNRSLLSVSDAFVSHTHMDHFMDLDRLIRVNLKQAKTIQLFGPEPFITQMSAKLLAYTWDRCESCRLELRIIEVSHDKLTELEVKACEGFHALHAPSTYIPQMKEQGLLLVDAPQFRVWTSIHDHHIPCLAFRIDQKKSIKINGALLKEHGLVPGDWLQQVRAEIHSQSALDTRVTVETTKGLEQFSLSELEQYLIMEVSPVKIGYLVDASPAPENLNRLRQFFMGTDILYCEAAFLQKDSQLAQTYCHLTAKAAGELARSAHIKRLIPCHFSPRYEDQTMVVTDEITDAFSGK